MRVSKAVKVRDIQIGGGAPVVVQSMTKTDTTDVDGTLRQIYEMVEAGCEIVRIAVPDDDVRTSPGGVEHHRDGRSCILAVVADAGRAVQDRRCTAQLDRAVHDQPRDRPGEHQCHHGCDQHRPVRAAAGAPDRPVGPGGPLGDGARPLLWGFAEVRVLQDRNPAARIGGQ